MSKGAYYSENDPFAAAWLRELVKGGHIAPGDVDERDIQEVRPAEIGGYTQCHFFAGIGGWSRALRLAGWPDDRPVWTGSCPCQPFSAAGRQAGFKDPRHLWPDWFRLIQECRPGVVLGEQVSSAPAWLDLVSGDLEGEGYAFGSAVLGAHSVAAPHIRQRFYFVADRGDVADAERAQLRARGRGGHGEAQAGVQGEDGERERLRHDAGEHGPAGLLADAEDGDGRGGERGAEAGAGEDGERGRGLAGGGPPGLVEHPDDARREGDGLRAVLGGGNSGREILRVAGSGATGVLGEHGVPGEQLEHAEGDGRR